MAFDRNDPVQLAALKAELTLDPAVMGYVTVNNDNQLAALMNDAEANPGGETTGAALTRRSLWLLCAAHADDLTPKGSFSAGDQFAVAQLFEITDAQDDDVSWARAAFRALFNANDGIVAALDALQRVISRAEVLFGVDTVLTGADISAAKALP